MSVGHAVHDHQSRWRPAPGLSRPGLDVAFALQPLVTGLKADLVAVGTLALLPSAPERLAERTCRANSAALRILAVLHEARCLGVVECADGLMESAASCMATWTRAAAAAPTLSATTAQELADSYRSLRAALFPLLPSETVPEGRSGTTREVGP